MYVNVNIFLTDLRTILLNFVATDCMYFLTVLWKNLLPNFTKRGGGVKGCL